MEKKQIKQAKLVLEDGSEYSGWAFGKARSQAGEVVFNTGMTGGAQVLTNPEARGQIIVSAYPLAGNCGVPAQKNGEPFLDEQGLPVHFESERIQAAGIVVSELCEEPSHFSSTISLSAWLEKGNVPGIYGVDTRALTVRLRERGTMRGKILVEGSRDVTFDSGIIANPVSDVSQTQVKTFVPACASGAEESGERIKIAVIDCGIKSGLIRCLLERNVEVVRVPWNHDLSGIDYDGLLLSGGPGDPKECGKTIATVRKAFTTGKPVFGVALGNEIMALAAGADTYKLPFGHRGQNQPCLETGTKRCYITSQSHGYAVRGDTLPRDWETWFVNANDGTVEGIRSLKFPFAAVQFNPEGCPGPRDTEFLIDGFIDRVTEFKKDSGKNAGGIK